jgi:hypothetical protein
MFVVFHLVIVFSVLRRFTDYPFGIFKLFTQQLYTYNIKIQRNALFFILLIYIVMNILLP